MTALWECRVSHSAMQETPQIYPQYLQVQSSVGRAVGEGGAVGLLLLSVIFAFALMMFALAFDFLNGFDVVCVLERAELDTLYK